MLATLAKAIIIGSAVTAASRFIVTAMPLGWSPEHAEPISEAIGFWMMSSVAFTFVLSPVMAVTSFARIRAGRGVVAAICGVAIPLMMLAFLSRDNGILSGLLLNIGHWFERPSFFVKEYLPVVLGGIVFGYLAADGSRATGYREVARLTTAGADAVRSARLMVSERRLRTIGTNISV
jgi:hypothetical protein